MKGKRITFTPTPAQRSGSPKKADSHSGQDPSELSKQNNNMINKSTN